MLAHSAAILGYLRAQREPLVAFRGKLVRAESPSSDPASHSGVRSLLAGELEARGFSTRFVAGQWTGGHLIARPHRRRRQAPQQLVIGHYDTVWPVGNLAHGALRVRRTSLASTMSGLSATRPLLRKTIIGVRPRTLLNQLRR